MDMFNKSTKIGVIGLWHLGCVVSAAWSKLGFHVTAFDYDMKLVDNLSKGNPPLFEPHLEDTLNESMNNNTLSFSTNIKDLQSCEVVFIAYDTPVSDNDDSDLTPLKRAIEDCAHILKDGAIVVISSQTPAGTCKSFRQILKKTNSSLDIVYSPENLRLGEAIDCYLHPGRIIIGSDSIKTRDKIMSLFKYINTDLLTMSLTSAEMVKHSINSFLSTSIVFTNHLADLCEVAGANILDVVKGMKSDERIGAKAYLSAGIGFSGGTLGRDLKILSKLNTENGLDASLFANVHHWNTERATVIVGKIISLLGGDVSGKRIGVLGLTYKPGTSTLRRSLPLEIVDRLLDKGANVRVHDPNADYSELDHPRSFEICDSIDKAVSEVEMILLLTEWPEFKAYNWPNVETSTKQPIFFDAKNYLFDQKLCNAGYKYCGVGLTDGEKYAALK